MRPAAIDVHKKMLAVVIGDGTLPFERQRFGTMPSDLIHR